MTHLPRLSEGSAPGAEDDAPSSLAVLRLGGARVAFTGRAQGDMAGASGLDPDGDRRRRAVVDRPWTVLRQVHGWRVVVVDQPGAACGAAGDACVSVHPGVALAVVTADCAPVAFASPEGVIGVAHAGWRGLVGGVVEATVTTMRQLGAESVYAALGPCIHAECYAFGSDDLDAAASCFGDVVRAETGDGAPALDLAQAVHVAVRRAGAELTSDAGVCTSCSGEHWSWRARQDRQRQATVVWMAAGVGGP